MYQAIFAIQMALFVQADAKIANGMFWTGVWMWVASHPVEAVARLAEWF